MNTSTTNTSDVRAKIEAFQRDGFCVLRGLRSGADCARILERAMTLAQDPSPPLEYEAETGYPGAPTSLEAPGGRTLRRIRSIYERDPLFQEQARHPEIVRLVAGLLQTPLALSQAHHNCVMFKDPRYGSETGWHQDMRYWRFERPELVTAWLALTDAGEDAGCLYFVPESHRLDFEAERFDEEQFFRPEHPENARLLERAQAVPLKIGDVVLFHSRLLHAAYRNRSARKRVSLIFTYRSQNNRPLPGTRSAADDDVLLQSEAE